MFNRRLSRAEHEICNDLITRDGGIYTVVAHMLVTARKNYSMIYAYAVSFIGCIKY